MNTDYFDWHEQYRRTHSTFPAGKMRPVIGITGNFGDKGCELAQGYYESILRAGGTPIIIPPYEDRDALINTLERIDGLLLSGGGDLNPLFVGEEPIKGLHGICPQRDLSELLLIRLAYDRQIPILGICRGIQMLTAALEGTLYQDIYSQCAERELLKHSQDLDRCYASHTVQIDKGSRLHRIMNSEVLAVNSFHHQAVSTPGPHLKVCATSSDGIIEAVESNEHKPILAVQWHPECFVLRNDTCMLPLFQWLVNEATLFSSAKSLHHSILSLDSHCDTPMLFKENICFHERDPRILMDLHKMHEGHLDSCIMVAYLPQGERSEIAHQAATNEADHILDQIEKMVQANHSAVEIVRTPSDLYRLKAQGKKALMLGLENGYAIGNDLSRIEHFRQRGVVYMTLCHNGDNDICDSAKGKNEHGGISDFGRQVIREMNRTGMMVDLSHASERSFYDALELSSTPIVCSHSSCKALCDVPRNLSDEQLKALAQKGGVAQVTLYHGFLRTDGKANILDAIQHLNHMVEVMGIEHVGIGTDFDGDGGVPGCASASELINITRLLMTEGYSEEDIRLVWGGNFLRVMEQVQRNAQ